MSQANADILQELGVSFPSIATWSSGHSTLAACSTASLFNLLTSRYLVAGGSSLPLVLVGCCVLASRSVTLAGAPVNL